MASQYLQTGPLTAPIPPHHSRTTPQGHPQRSAHRHHSLSRLIFPNPISAAANKVKKTANQSLNPEKSADIRQRIFQNQEEVIIFLRYFANNMPEQEPTSTHWSAPWKNSHTPTNSPTNSPSTQSLSFSATDSHHSTQPHNWSIKMNLPKHSLSFPIGQISARNIILIIRHYFAL